MVAITTSRQCCNGSSSTKEYDPKCTISQKLWDESQGGIHFLVTKLPAMRNQLHLQSAIYLPTLIWTALLRLKGHFHRSQTLYIWTLNSQFTHSQVWEKDKTKVSIIEDEGHSYGAILAEFDKKQLDICMP